MKRISIIVIICILSTPIFGQKKIYNVGQGKNKPVKGTFAKLTLESKFETNSEDKEALIATGTILAAAAGPFLNSALGAVRTREEKKAALSQATSVSNSLMNDVDLNSGLFLSISNCYIPKKAGEQKDTSFQTFNLRAIFEPNIFNHGKSTKAQKDTIGITLNFELIDFSSDFSKAYIKESRDMLIYTVTLSGKVIYEEIGKDGTAILKAQDYTTEFLFYVSSANQPNKPIGQINKVLFPQNTKYFTLNATIKEANPYYQSYNSLVNFLENYGENLTDLVTGLIIESDD